MRHSTELSINLKYLENNFNKLKAIAPHNEIIFMVKANGYGHGIEQVSRFSHKELGIKNLGVASVGEAMQLRKKQPDLKCELIVFSDTEISNKNYEECYTDYRITPVLHQIEHLQYFLENSNFKKIPIFLKFDTGMNRLGISHDEVEKVIELLKRYGRSEVQHLMTHFSSSFLKIKPENRTSTQFEKFINIKRQIESSGISIVETSCSNSGAIEQGFGLDQTHIRPGLMLYGPRSYGMVKKEGLKLWDGESVSKLCSKIISIKEIKRGTPVGYGGHVSAKDGILVNLPIGYGDGFLTFYSGVKLTHLDYEYQVIGRVNMDIASLLFPMEAASKLKVADKITLWDHDSESILDFSTKAKTIPYQVYTAITKRVPREYHYQ